MSETPAEATRYLYLNSKLAPAQNETLRRGKVGIQNGEDGLCGFDGMVHRSTKFEEYVGRIVDYVRLGVARFTLRSKVNKVRTGI